MSSANEHTTMTIIGKKLCSYFKSNTLFIDMRREYHKLFAVTTKLRPYF